MKLNQAHRLFAVLVTVTSFGALSIISAWAAAYQAPLKIGFVMVGPVNDMGYNLAHDLGRRFMEGQLSSRVETTFAEKVPENSEAERVMEKMIAQGTKLIFMTSYGYLEPGLHVAARHPDVIFMQANRVNKTPMKNVGTYIVDYSDPMYAAGIVAGRITKSNQIGYELGHPIAPLIREVDTFTLGARSVNPDVKVQIIWTNSWADPPTEAEAAKSLIDKGADIIVSHFDTSLAAVRAADANNVYSIGCHADLQDQSKGWLTGQCSHWGPLYVKIVNSVLNHSWRAENKRYDLKDGYVKLCTFGAAVPRTVRQESTDKLRQIVAGEFIVFKGPIQDRDGNVRIAAGQTADAQSLEAIDWLVAGVDGAIPKK
jgi:basic membrane protein A